MEKERKIMMKKFFAVVCSLCLSMAMVVSVGATGYSGGTLTYTPDKEGFATMEVTYEITPEMLDTSAAGVYTYVPEDPDFPTMTIYTDPESAPVPMAGDVIHINNVHHTGSDDFNESFSCDSGDGNHLNIYVKNNTSESVIVNITCTRLFIPHDYPAEYVSGNDDETFTFERNGGIDGKWEINVTSADGHEMDINVGARQYQIN